MRYAFVIFSLLFGVLVVAPAAAQPRSDVAPRCKCASLQQEGGGPGGVAALGAALLLGGFLWARRLR